MHPSFHGPRSFIHVVIHATIDKCLVVVNFLLHAQRNFRVDSSYITLHAYILGFFVIVIMGELRFYMAIAAASISSRESPSPQGPMTDNVWLIIIKYSYWFDFSDDTPGLNYTLRSSIPVSRTLTTIPQIYNSGLGNRNISISASPSFRT